MVLFVQDGCRWCEQFKARPGLVLARMVGTTRGIKARIGDTLIDPPIALKAYPTLLDGEKVYVGKAAIAERLRT